MRTDYESLDVSDLRYAAVLLTVIATLVVECFVFCFDNQNPELGY